VFLCELLCEFICWLIIKVIRVYISVSLPHLRDTNHIQPQGQSSPILKAKILGTPIMKIVVQKKTFYLRKKNNKFSDKAVFNNQ